MQLAGVKRAWNYSFLSIYMMFHIFDYFTPIFVYIVKSTIDFRFSLDQFRTGPYIAEKIGEL